MTTDVVEEEFQQLAVQKRITRVDGFQELRALAHALLSIDKKLDIFFLPNTLLWKPLKASQARVVIDGKFMVYEKHTGQLLKQIPDGYSFASQPILISISDQGGVNRGVLDYATHYLKMVAVIAFDSHHRTWNDIKSCLKQVGVFKSVLSFAMLFNINYGPQNSKKWFNKKKAALKEFEKFHGPLSPDFVALMPMFCAERGELEDGSIHQRERLFKAMLGMKSCQVCGPLTKLMRWWSWFECHQFYSGEVWFTKLLMQSTLDPEGNLADAVPFTLPQADGLTPQQELRELKIKHGSWALAPSLVTQESFWQKTLIFELAKPLWSMYSSMSKEVQHPRDVLSFTIKMSNGGWKEELASIIANGFFDTAVIRKLYFTEGPSEERLTRHSKFVALLHKRALSLVGAYLKPPYRYSGLGDPATEAETRKVMKAEWDTILQAEELKEVLVLDHTHFLNTSFCRLSYLANEADLVGRLTGAASQAVLLCKAACRHLGDTVVVENSHQQAKDLLRSARHKVTSRLGKFHSIIKSTVLKGRGLDYLQVEDAKKATASISKNANMSVVKATHPNSHKMQKRFQEVMKYKAFRPNFTWPSTTQESLFAEAASLELLLSETCLDMVRADGLNSATLTCLVGKPGSILANRVESRVLMVLAVAPLNFLSWELEVVASNEESGFVSFQLCRANATTWHSVTELDDWLTIPCMPKLQNRFGPLLYQQCSAALPLPEAMVASGLSLPVAQCLVVLKHYGVQPASKKKADLYQQIIELFLDNPEEQQQALARSDLKQQKQPGAAPKHMFLVFHFL